ncbi:hypothetical protein [Robertmurraya massiliosenegalensis]|uniref:hypothetical protein n=1 Tax=Robertmurraya massiliosenegalensis TaxID=1287657 RepID=UPI0002D4529F|nr:hypothetical protein [Robertmurraya massiliosenegalensis]
MEQVVTFILLLPLIVWSIFQQPLYNNAVMIEESLQLAIYEGQKEASLKGRYDEEIYKEMRDYLVETHNYRPELIEINGTETLTPRGEKLAIKITVPKPLMTVIDLFKIDTSEPFTVQKTILSEYKD